jgi:hypothetical protein
MLVQKDDLGVWGKQAFYPSQGSNGPRTRVRAGVAVGTGGLSKMFTSYGRASRGGGLRFLSLGILAATPRP